MEITISAWMFAEMLYSGKKIIFTLLESRSTSQISSGTVNPFLYIRKLDGTPMMKGVGASSNWNIKLYKFSVSNALGWFWRFYFLLAPNCLSVLVHEIIYHRQTILSLRVFPSTKALPKDFFFSYITLFFFACQG